MFPSSVQMSNLHVIHHMCTASMYKWAVQFNGEACCLKLEILHRLTGNSDSTAKPRVFTYFLCFCKTGSTHFLGLPTQYAGRHPIMTRAGETFQEIFWTRSAHVEYVGLSHINVRKFARTLARSAPLNFIILSLIARVVFGKFLVLAHPRGVTRRGPDHLVHTYNLISQSSVTSLQAQHIAHALY